MEGHGHDDPDLAAPDGGASHRALQEALRGPDTLGAATAELAHAGPLGWTRGLMARAMRFLLRPQVAFNGAVARTLEQTIRAGDARDRWIERIVVRLRDAEQRVRALEAEVRAARAAEEEARKKLALVALRLRELDERGAPTRDAGN